MKRKLPNLVNIAIITLITIITWIGFGVYRQVTSEPEPVVNTEILEPLNPTLDSTTLVQLENRVYLDDSEVEGLVGQIRIDVSEEEEEAEETPRPSPSPTPEPGTNP